VGSLKVWLLETRPQFLLLTPVCVFTGVAASLYQGHPFNVLYFVLAFVGALFAHISVNVLNDYFDYRSGIDIKAKRTPFSGGSGILPAALLKPRKVYLLGIGSLCLVAAIGIYFLWVYGLSMLPIGLLGVLLIYLYTPYATKLPGVSEVAAGGFSLIVLGTYFTQSGTYGAIAAVVTGVAGLLIANLLLLNEFPDVEADRSAGRRQLPIVLGRQKAAKVYCLILASTYALIIAGAVAEILPLLALLGLATLPLGIKAMKGALKYHSDINALVPYLGTNVFVVLLTPLLMSVGIIIWGFV
jgi:1,4-dihydroxy-2-naphthoate octaprenyltransferase